MIILFQIIFSLFALFAIVSVWSKKRIGLLSAGGTIFWIIFWFLAVVFVWWPNSTVRLANFFGIGRGSDLVLYVSLAVIFYLLFKTHIKIEEINRNITKVVRDKSLK